MLIVPSGRSGPEGAGVDDIQDVPEFTSDFPDLPAVRRRRLAPPLLWHDAEETRRRPVFVEWSDDGVHDMEAGRVELPHAGG